MTPTPKWNTELPLRKPRKVPPTRRYDIVIDKAKPVRVALKPVVPKKKLIPKKERYMYEIKGTPLRDDEILVAASEMMPDELIVTSSGIHRVGERIPGFPSGHVMTKAKARQMFERGQLKIPKNLVNSFPSDRIRSRQEPFGKKLSLEAIAAANPAAYRGLVIHPEAHLRGVTVDVMGSVWVQDDMGFFKKVGKFVKKGAKGIAKGAKKGAKGIAKGAKKGFRGAKRGARSATRFTKKAARGAYRGTRRGLRKTWKYTKKSGRALGRFAKKHAAGIALTAALGPAGLAGYVGWNNRKKIWAVTKAVGRLAGKALVELARVISSAAATPIRLAFRQFIGLPRARAIAKSKGRQSPSRQDKSEAVKWGFEQVKKKLGKLGWLVVKILKFTRGVPLSGDIGNDTSFHVFRGPAQTHYVGAIDPATISAYATAITAALSALKGSLKFFSGLKKGKPAEAAEGALQAADSYNRMQQSYDQARGGPPPQQAPGYMSQRDPGYGAYGSAQDAGDYQSYGNAQDYQAVPGQSAYPGYAPVPQRPAYGYQTPGMINPLHAASAAYNAVRRPVQQFAQQYVQPVQQFAQRFAAPAQQFYQAAQATRQAINQPAQYSSTYNTNYDTAFSTMGRGRGLPPLISFG